MTAAGAAVFISIVMNSKGLVLYFSEEWYIEYAFSKSVSVLCMQVPLHRDFVVLIMMKCFLKHIDF